MAYSSAFFKKDFLVFNFNFVPQSSVEVVFVQIIACRIFGILNQFTDMQVHQASMS